MGNWDEQTLLKEVVFPFIAGDGAHLLGSVFFVSNCQSMEMFQPLEKNALKSICLET